MPTSMAVVSKVSAPRKEAPAACLKEADENSGPTTTVFVGNISEKASDMLIRQLLSVSSGVVWCKTSCMITQSKQDLELYADFTVFRDKG